MATPKILKYSEESMVKALKAVADGSSFREAAQRYNVPKTTLLYKFNGKYPLKRQMGPSTVLTTAEEQQLADWVIYCADIGFPVSKLHLIDSVELLLKELKRDTLFTNNRPGRAWYDRFLERNHLSERMAQNLTKARAAVTESDLRNWFADVENHLTSINALDILKDPARIYNMDESGFHLTPEPGKVLVKKGTKAVYSVSQNDEKECLTVLLGSNADGVFVPPMVVFPYIRLPPRIAQSAPTGWGIGKSESGWMFGELFLDYIVNVFHPWLVRNKVQLPIVLFIDGHVSHLTMALSTFCRANGIILFSLYPNATHIYQPMDIGLFHVLKDDWKVVVYNERMDRAGARIQKEDFCKLLLEVLVKIDSGVLRNSFRASGLYPFDANAVDYSSLINNTMETKSAKPESSQIENAMGSSQLAQSEVNSMCEDINIEEYRNHLSFIEKWIDYDTLSKFKSCGDVWNGSEDNKNLFELWHNIFKVSYVRNNDRAYVQPSIAVCNNEGDIIVNGEEHLDGLTWDFNDEIIESCHPKSKRAKYDRQTTEASKSSITAELEQSMSLIMSENEQSTALTTYMPDRDLCTLKPVNFMEKLPCEDHDQDEASKSSFMVELQLPSSSIMSENDQSQSTRTSVMTEVHADAAAFLNVSTSYKLITPEPRTESFTAVMPTSEYKSITQVPSTDNITASTESMRDNELSTFSPKQGNSLIPLPDVEIRTLAHIAPVDDIVNEELRRQKPPCLPMDNKKKINKQAFCRLDEYFKHFDKQQEAKKLLEVEKLRRKQQREKKSKAKLSSGSAYSFIEMERGNSVVECRQETLGTEETVDTSNFTESGVKAVASLETMELNKNCETTISAFTPIQINFPDNVLTSATIQQNVPDKVSLAFQKVLLIPKIREKVEKKDKPKARQIYGITSDEWVEFYQSKEDAKKKLEDEKQQRKIERENKRKELELKQLQAKEIRQKLKEERDEKKRECEVMKLQRKLQLEEKKNKKQQLARKPTKKQHNIESTECNKQNVFTENTFVIVKYDTEYYPGLIKELKAEMAYISVMVMAGVEQWKWPRIPDVMWYDLIKIIETIGEPKANDRGFLQVAEMSKYVNGSQ